MQQTRLPGSAAVLHAAQPLMNYRPPDSPFVRDDDGALLPFVETIAVGCIYVGMHSIQHKRAVAEYFWRATALALVGERWLAHVSRQDVHRCIGLEVYDAKPLTRPRFMAQVRRILESRTDDVVERFAGSPFSRIEASYFGPRD